MILYDAKCTEYAALKGAVEAAAKTLADVLSAVYDELGRDMLPPYELELAKAETLEKIALGIVGVFIPLTPEDVAIEAALWAVTTPAAGAVIGRATSVFRGLGDLFSG